MSNKTTFYNDLRLQRELCDAVIKVEDVEFHIHKVILCNCSMYFRAMFSSWSKRNQMIYNIPGISSDMMQLIITFAYNGSVSVSEGNVQELLHAADYLNVTDIVQVCCEFLGAQLCPENCIGIWQHTSRILNMKLNLQAYNYIIDHFEEVLSCEEFLQLSVDELTSFIAKDELQVKNERQLFEAVIHWINHNKAERERHFTVLLKHIRLGLAGADYISTNVMSHELVRNNRVCRFAVQALLSFLRSTPPIDGIFYPFSRPRLPHAVLLAIGGWSGGDPTNGIEAYDFRANHWSNVTRHGEHPRAYHGVVFLNGNVFCIGGFDRMEYFNSMRRLDLSTFRWHEAAPMYYRRCYVSVTVLDGHIYAMGGYDGRVRLQSAERYRPESNQWSVLAPMHEQRSDASCTTLNNKVYICGGFNGIECLQTCEHYTPETNQWTIFSQMLSPRSGIGVTAYAGHVYAVGGFDGNNRLSSAESYNPDTNTWHALPHMLSPRSNFGIEVIDDRIFAVGGYNGNTTSENVEYYDLTTNQWSDASDMAICRSAVSCCVVPVMERFVISRDELVLDMAEDDAEETGESSEVD